MRHEALTQRTTGGLLGALAIPNFRLYFLGQTASMVGTWAQRVAMAWLAYRLTGSVWILGVLGFASGISMLVLAPFGGALCDRYDRRRLMLVTQWLMLLQALALLGLTWSGWIGAWHLVALALVLGTISAIDTPIRHTLIAKLVPERERLSNAIALNSLLMNGARVAGPAIASLLLALFSEAACFALNAASFAFMLIALHRMRWNDAAPSKQTLTLRFLADGLRYARDHAPIRRSLLFVAVVSLTVSPYTNLMPAIVGELYTQGSSALGLLLSSGGVGAVLSALMLANQRTARRMPLLGVAGAAVSGAAFGLLPLAPALWWAAGLMVLVGGGMITAVASSNIWIQHEVDESMRGRVMGLYAMAALGMQPVGSLAAGALGAAVGMPLMLVANGFACALAAGLYLRRVQSGA